MFQFNEQNANQLKNDIKKSAKSASVFISLALLAGLIFTSFYTVEPDEEAVVIRLGKYFTTNQPGLHFKIPFGVDRIIKVETKRILQEEFGFRTTDVSRRRTQYSSKNFEDESLMLTGDLNVADVEWAIQYQISDPFKFVFHSSNPRRNIRDVSESIMRRVVGDRLVSEVLTTGRAEVASEARNLMQDVLDKKYDIGIKIITVKLQDVNPPEKVKPSFNEVNKAKQQQETVINQAKEAYNRVIPEARGKAVKLVSEAEAYSTALINRSLGDAEKFNEIYKEYKRAPKVTKSRIYLETMEDIFARIEDITIVDPQVKGLLPIYQQPTGKAVK
jgi:membrane protease subunit HflK